MSRERWRPADFRRGWHRCQTWGGCLESIRWVEGAKRISYLTAGPYILGVIELGVRVIDHLQPAD